jgi:hypothetical protein
MRSEEGSVQFINRMDEFWRFFEETRESPLDERLQIFKTKIIEPNLAYYSNVLGINDDGLRQYIMEIEPKIGALFSSQDKVLTRFHNNLKMFLCEFPDFRTDFNTYLLPSLNLFKGMTVPFQGKILLLLGIDALAELTDLNFKGYITHELFHAYHFQHSSTIRDATELALRTMKMPPLWGLLWTEGIACQAVRIVFPEIPEEDVLDWRPLVDQTKPILPDLAGEARRILVSDLPQDIAGFFYFPRGNNSNIPTGCGYYIGMLVASKLTKRHPIDALLRLDDEELVNEIDSALMELQR